MRNVNRNSIKSLLDTRGLKTEKALNSDGEISCSQNMLVPPRTADAQTHGSSPVSSKNFGKSKGNAVAPLSDRDAL